MDATLKDLASLAVHAVPTVLFYIFLTFFLKKVFFVPVSAILAERRKQTEGMRDLAQKAHAAATAKTSECEAAMQLARAQILQENDALRRQWAAEQAHRLSGERELAEQQISAAKASAANELQSAKNEIGSSVDRLGTQIVDALSRRRAA